MRDLKVNYLRSLFKGTPWIYSKLSFVYQELVRPFVAGYTFFWVYYCLFIKKKEITHLKQIGFSDISIFNPRTWRYGKSMDKAYRRYYSAFYKGKLCFVKIATRDKTVENEVFVQKKIFDSNLPYTPRCLKAMDEFALNTHLLAIEFVKDLEVINKSDMDQKWFKEQILDILDYLEKLKLVHADIHPGNLMKSGNRLFLMDFGISKFLDCDNNVNYIERPGTYFIKQGKYRIYDDAYSVLSMIMKVGYCKDQNFIEKLNNRVGKVTLLVDTNGK